MKSHTLSSIISGLALLLLAGAGCSSTGRVADETNESNTALAASSITNFDECVAAGYAILKSNPLQCRTPDGTMFVDKRPTMYEPEANPENSNIHVFLQPDKSELLVRNHLLTVSGEARGTWFFEASFPVELYDSAGTMLSVGVAQGSGDWMSENFVPFSFTLSVPRTAIGLGTLILKKDNPSGDPARDDSYSVPVQL